MYVGGSRKEFLLRPPLLFFPPFTIKMLLSSSSSSSSLLMPIIRDSITGIKERERGPPCPLLLFHRDLAWVQKASFYPLPRMPMHEFGYSKKGKAKGGNSIGAAKGSEGFIGKCQHFFGGKCLFFSIYLHGRLWDCFFGSQTCLGFFRLC